MEKKNQILTLSVLKIKLLLTEQFPSVGSVTLARKGLNLNEIYQQKHVILTPSTLVNLEQVNLMGFQTESNWLKSCGEIEPEKTETTKLQQHWYDISR